MRLTLRTLLAYLDDILDPEDADQLRKKIEDSEFATSLVQQIQGSVRRLRLDAPALDAQGVGGDLNSVAEYLDNVLPPEQVPALEKACLDSEVNLGEVASCHQILTLVLGEPADATDRLRARAYSLCPTSTSELPELPTSAPSDATTQEGPPPAVPSAFLAPAGPSLGAEVAGQVPEPSAPDGQAAGPAPLPSTRETWRAESEQSRMESQASTPKSPSALNTPVGRPAPASPHSQMAYPDPLNRKSSVLRSTMITGVVALLILAGLLFAMRPREDNLAARWLGTSTPARDARRDADDHISVEPSPDDPPIEVEVIQPVRPANAYQNDSRFESAHGTEGSEAANATSQDAQQTGDAAASGHEREPDQDSLASPQAQPPQPQPRTDQVTRGETASVDDLSTESRLDANPGLDLVVVEPQLPTKDDIREVPPAPADPLSNLARNAASSAPTVLEEVVPIVDPAMDVEAEPIRPSVARAVQSSTDSVPDDAPDGAPSELPEETSATPGEPAKLKYGDQMLLTFNPQAADWLRVEASELLETGAYLLGLPAFQADLEMGGGLVCSVVDATRIQLGPMADMTIHDGKLLLRNSEPEIAKTLRFVGDRFEIKMTDADALVAVEADRLHVPGTDPTEVPHSLLKIFALSGNIAVTCRGASHDVDEGSHFIAFDNFEPTVQETQKRPNWTTSSSFSTAESNAVRSFKTNFDNSQNIRLWLREQASRRYGDRALAARCLAEMDEFDAIIAALNDPEQRAFWNKHFAALRRALTRGKETIDTLRLELERAHGDRAEFMMEMIRGYNGRQLAAGAAATLVRYLEHRQLDHRVLAIQNLKNITGYSLTFRPEKAAGYRSTAVRRWKGRLAAGKVVYADAPEVVSLLESYSNQTERADGTP